ncbi:MAG: serine/threonine-protein kinase [Myxococcota bacterium]
MAGAPEDDLEAARALAAVERSLFGGGQSQAAPSIGRFALRERIGHGGMGVVYAAWDPELSRKVAVKVVRPDTHHTTGAQLIAEARALAQIEHPNVVTIYDAGETGGRVWIAMEFVAGNLADWLRDEPPPAAILDAFAQAGAGLAAAHHAGIVHRDFKPANVLRTDDGVAIVADFGLARAFEDADGTAGTPYYMSLEQIDGANVDARSDQFSYCVALHQALWGGHPYEGKTHQQRVAAIIERRLQPPGTRNPDVPETVRRALLQGVDADPDRRFQDMPALLDALFEAPARRRRRWIAGATLGLGGAAAAVVAVGGTAEPRPCRAAEDSIAPTWNEGRSEAVVAAVRGTGVSNASEIAPRLVQALDDYAARWTVMRVEACEAATVRHEQSERIFDLRIACLQRRQDALAAVLGRLEQIDAANVQHALDAVHTLPSLRRCADVDALSATVPPPDDPETAIAVRALEASLADAEALFSLRMAADAAEAAQPLVVRADALGWAPARARAVRLLARAESWRGETSAGARQEEAVWLAQAAGDDEAVAAAALDVIRGIGANDPRSEKFERWLRTAQSAVQRLGRRTDLELRLLQAEATVYARRGEPAAALTAIDRALWLAEDTGDSSVSVASLHLTRGNILWASHDLDGAAAAYDRAATGYAQSLGPDHPKLAALHQNLGSLAFTRNDTVTAREHFVRALKLVERGSGADSSGYADVAWNLALIDTADGNYDEAVRRIDTIAAIYRKLGGDKHPEMPALHEQWGRIARARGDLEEATKQLERMVTLREDTLGPDAPELADGIMQLGEIAAQRGDAALARKHLLRAQRLAKASPAPNPAVLTAIDQALAEL